VVVGQADRDDAVDDRPMDRPGEGAVERRDEMEPVAGLLGDPGDPRAERAEERVREDHRQVLRGEDADRAGPPLGEHPRDRVRAVAQLGGDAEDPRRGRGVEPVGAVEGKGDCGLRDACALGNVGDRHPTGDLLHAAPPSAQIPMPPIPERDARPEGSPQPCMMRWQNRFSKPVYGP
jgi:hypothetical protein